MNAETRLKNRRRMLLILDAIAAASHLYEDLEAMADQASDLEEHDRSATLQRMADDLACLEHYGQEFVRLAASL